MALRFLRSPLLCSQGLFLFSTIDFLSIAKIAITGRHAVARKSARRAIADRKKDDALDGKLNQHRERDAAMLIGPKSSRR